jgi:hypothetical protein
VLRHLQLHFDYLVDNDPLFASFVSALIASGGLAVVFGGWVRDAIISLKKGVAFQPRDIDIVIDGPNHDELDQMLPQSRKVNIFDGFTIQMSSLHLDTWILKNTYLISKFDLPIHFRMLPKTTVFRINSIIFYPAQFWTQPDLYEHGCIDAISRRAIDFQSSIIPLPMIQVARAVIYATKLAFDIETDVLDFIKTVCDNTKNIEKVMEGIDLYGAGRLKAEAKALLQSIVDI